MNLPRIGLTTLVALAFGLAVIQLVSSGTLLSLFTQAIIYAIFAIGIPVAPSSLRACSSLAAST